MLKTIISLVLFSAVNVPSYQLNTPQPPIIRTVLNFTDGSVEICNATGYTINYTNLTVAVEACYPDEIFKNGFQ